MAAVLATITTLALAWFIIAATAAPAHADALCDAMRARFGPGYPCISVPTNTFTHTAPAAPTTTNPGQQSSGGPQVGIDVGPGPGIGNGTPIVPVPGAPTAAPGTTRAPAATPTTPQVPARPTQPGQQTAQPAPQATQPPPSTSSRPTAPTTTPAPAPAGTSAPTQKASIPTTDDNTSDQTTQMLWLLGGAAAIVAGATSTRSGGIGRYRATATANGYPTVGSALRSWLPGGGSERARIGNSQYVLINDPTSPRSYVFHENVPPGGHMSVNPDGTATIYNKDGQPVGTIAEPWAYDSLGHPQKTWYTVDNNGNLVQHIDPEPNALYPILADPPDPSARLKQAQQQQAAAAQGHPAHQPGTGTPLNKSPKANPPPPPPATPPPANKPDYSGDPHSQAGTHSGLPAQDTASGPDVAQQTPEPSTTPRDNTGLRNALTAPIRDQPQEPSSRSSLQGATPEPNQRFTYDDWLKNNYLGQSVSDGPDQFSDDSGATWRRDGETGLGGGQVWRNIDAPNTTITVIRNSDGSTTYISNAGDITRVGRDGGITQNVHLDDGKAIAGSDVSDAVLTLVPGVGLVRSGRLILSLVRSGMPSRGGRGTANDGDTSPVFISREADNGKGVIYQLEKDVGNGNGNTGSVRIMQPTKRYPNGYARFYNDQGQPMNELGKPGSKPDSHFRIEPDGTFKLPQGW
ncbi:hypothetical protein [Williamsia maris]|nr:hypothetical protein [Williamsia maris]